MQDGGQSQDRPGCACRLERGDGQGPVFLTVRLCPPRSSKWGSSDFSQHIWLLLDGSFLTPAPYSPGLTLVQRLGLGNRQHRQKRSRSGPSPTQREKQQLVALIPGDGLGGGT